MAVGSVQATPPRRALRVACLLMGALHMRERASLCCWENADDGQPASLLRTAYAVESVSDTLNSGGTGAMGGGVVGMDGRMRRYSGHILPC